MRSQAFDQSYQEGSMNSIWESMKMLGTLKSVMRDTSSEGLLVLWNRLEHNVDIQSISYCIREAQEGKRMQSHAFYEHSLAFSWSELSLSELKSVLSHLVP